HCPLLRTRLGQLRCTWLWSVVCPDGLRGSFPPSSPQVGRVFGSIRLHVDYAAPDSCRNDFRHIRNHLAEQSTPITGAELTISCCTPKGAPRGHSFPQG